VSGTYNINKHPGMVVARYCSCMMAGSMYLLDGMKNITRPLSEGTFSQI